MISYLTVDKQGESDHTVSRSRFIGYCVHINSEDEALSFLSSVRKEYWDAKHHCYAYVLGEDSGRMKYSDDGEPAGTAGMPILNAIKCKKLTYTLIIVIRYFGGVLLGTGGLVRAYSKAASDAIQNATLVSMEECSTFNISIPYPIWPRIGGFLNENCLSYKIEYTDLVTINGFVRTSDYNDFCSRLVDRSDGQLHADFIESGLMPVMRS